MAPRNVRSFALTCFLVLVATGQALGQPFPNVQVNDRMNDPEETSIAINPRNPDNVVGVAQAPCRYYHTFDGGVTWNEGDLPDPWDLGDPSITFDRLGNAFYCYIGQWGHSGIFVNRSTDGGVTWMPAGTPVIEHQSSVPFEDKSYPVCDWTSGPHQDNLYVSWTQFTNYGSPNPADSTRILFARSTDSGISFSPPLRLSDRGGDAIDSDNTVEGAVPAVGPDGTIYVAWAGPRGIEFDRSTNAGITFGADRVIADQPGGWDFDVPGIYRANGLPVTKADISFGPHRGRVYVNWSDQRNGDTDVFLIYSDDGGQSWGPRIRVNNDPVGNGIHQFFTWFDVDPLTGTVYVLFYDRRAYNPSSTFTDVYLAYSEDGGAQFTNIKISASPFVPNQDAFFGDYTGISAFGGRVRPLWTRMEGSIRTIWTALIDRPTADVCSLLAAQGRIVIYPNPVRSMAQILCCAGLPVPVALSIQDIMGRRVRRIESPSTGSAPTQIVWDGTDDTGRRVASGAYLVRGAGLSPARVVVLR